jgi:hypothetical protein
MVVADESRAAGRSLVDGHETPVDDRSITGSTAVVGADPSLALAQAGVIAAALTDLAASVDGARHWPVDDRRELLRRLDRAVDGLVAVRGGVLVAERESGAWQGGGDRSYEAWRGRTGRIGHRSAAAQMRLADQLDAVPVVAAAVTEGRLPLEHAATIGRLASTGTPAQQAAALSQAGQGELLELAGRLDAGTFVTTVARWATTIDPDALEGEHEAQRRERFLHVVNTPNRTVIKGQLDLMAGHRLTLALEALTPRPAADDDRDAGQRAADALDTMATTVLGLADTKPGGHVPPQVSMILSEESWVAARAERDRRRRTADGQTTRAGADRATPSGSAHVPAAGVQDRGGHEPATLEDGTPIPVSELAAAMCDCEITRIVIDAVGAPLDLGRTQRLFSGPQRRAVIARDRECAWPECHLHARWCQIHHVRWWERDAGPTSVDNGVLLCSFHHHEVHRRDLAIERVAARTIDVSPAVAHTLGSGPAGTSLAAVAYTFLDRAGRPVAVPPFTDPSMKALRAAPDSSCSGRAVAAMAEGMSGVDPPDEPDLTWATDPVTGARVPAWWVEQ